MRPVFVSRDSARRFAALIAQAPRGIARFCAAVIVQQQDVDRRCGARWFGERFSPAPV